MYIYIKILLIRYLFVISHYDLINHHRVLIGPEGGFHQDEIKIALSSGIRPVNLGPRILRSETAAITAVSILQFLWGDL